MAGLEVTWAFTNLGRRKVYAASLVGIRRALRWEIGWD